MRFIISRLQHQLHVICSSSAEINPLHHDTQLITETTFYPLTVQRKQRRLSSSTERTAVFQQLLCFSSVLYIKIGQQGPKLILTKQ